jgi:hypothetical protein
MVAYALSGSGRALIHLGRSAEAIPLLEQALKIRGEKDPDGDRVGEVAFALAQALWECRPGSDRAVALARRALESYSQATLSKDHAAEVKEWLLGRDRSRGTRNLTTARN